MNPSSTWTTTTIAKNYWISGYGSNLRTPMFSVNDDAVNGISISSNRQYANLMFRFSYQTSETYIQIAFHGTGEEVVWISGGNSWSDGVATLGDEIYIQQIGTYLVATWSYKYGNSSNVYNRNKIIKLKNPDSILGKCTVELFTSKNETSGSGSGLDTDYNEAYLVYRTRKM